MQSIQSAPWANNLAASPPASPTDTRFTNNNAISKSKAKSNILINTNTNVGARRKSSLGNPAWSPSIIHDLDDNIVSPTTLLSRRPFSSIGSNLRLAAAMEEKDLQPQPGLSPWTSNMSAASPNGLLSPRSAETSNNASVDGAESAKNPFSYQTVSYTTENLRRDPKLATGQRRGHKYKHSSVSHQIFLEPAPRAPLQLPASLPMPTTREGWRSMSREQSYRLLWCCCHLLIAAFVQWSAQGSLAVTALSHLIFYDAAGAFLCAGVEVLSNFEVWKRTSIRHPFGLERTEVLVGFAMSILLLFMGFDLISHNAAHLLESAGDHEPHHEHQNHPVRVSAGSVDTVSLLAIISTLISAITFKNHARIARALRTGLESLTFLPAFLLNPSHLLTLSCSTILLLMPLLSFDVYTWFDLALSTAIALAMCGLGYQLVKTLGSMLLMSYSGAGLADVLRDIETDPVVKGVDEAKFWQVHYGLCMANLKLRVTGSEETLLKLRERVTTLVRTRLGGGYGQGGAAQSWEVSMQLILEKE